MLLSAGLPGRSGLWLPLDADAKRLRGAAGVVLMHNWAVLGCPLCSKLPPITANRQPEVLLVRQVRLLATAAAKCMYIAVELRQ